MATQYSTIAPASVRGPLQVSIDQWSDAEWDALLSGFRDAHLYQTSAYGKIHWGTRQLSRLAISMDGQVVGAAQVRVLPFPRYAGIAYVRWPLVEPAGRPFSREITMALVAALQREYVQQRGLYLKILPGAFEGTPQAAAYELAFAGFATFREEDRTMVVDLARSEEEILKSFSENARRKIRLAQEDEPTIHAGSNFPLYRIFSSLYAAMRDRKSFDTNVDVEEFGRTNEALAGKNKFHIAVCWQAEEPVAALVVSAIGERAEYVLGASIPAAHASGVTYLLHWSMMQWLRGQGAREYDLGGVDHGKNPGGYTFKSRFHGREVIRVAPRGLPGNALSNLSARFAFRNRTATGSTL